MDERKIDWWPVLKTESKDEADNDNVFWWTLCSWMHMVHVQQELFGRKKRKCCTYVCVRGDDQRILTIERLHPLIVWWWKSHKPSKQDATHCDVFMHCYHKNIPTLLQLCCRRQKKEAQYHFWHVFISIMQWKLSKRLFLEPHSSINITLMLLGY